MSVASDALTAEIKARSVRASDGVRDFIFAPASPLPLAALRIGVCAVLIVQAAFIAPQLVMFYASDGLVQSPITNAMTLDEVPRVAYLAAITGIGDARLWLFASFLAYLVGCHTLLLGWQPRISAAVAWLSHLTIKNSGYAAAYGVFEFTTIALFYCVVMPVGATLALTARTTESTPVLARISLRVLQVHLCIVYLASGVEKIVGEQWRNGEAVWRAVMRPGYAFADLSVLASVPAVPLAACWATLAIELGYCVFVWHRRTRVVWVLLTIGMHAGIAVLLGLWTFGAMMVALNVAAFLVPSEPGRSR